MAAEMAQVAERSPRARDPLASHIRVPKGRAATWRAVESLAARCKSERRHGRQVAGLALHIFDGLASMHGLGRTERFLLACGAMLHDIGWLAGGGSHHKASLRLILESADLPFNRRERLMVGSIARYHRKASPRLAHGHFAALAARDRGVVEKLAALVRLADGLDRSHRRLVRDIKVEITAKEIILRCAARGRAEAERTVALRKGGLFEEVFGRALRIQMAEG